MRLLLALALLFPCVASAQMRTLAQVSTNQQRALTLCIYGDSIVNDPSVTGNNTSGSEGKGVCDWCDPLVDAGFTIIAMAQNGATSWDEDNPSVVDSCTNYNTCTDGRPTGEQVALVEDASCPGGGYSTSCRDILGDTALESTTMEDVASYCDVFAFFFGANDAVDAVSSTDWVAVHQAVIEKAASLDKPVVFWEAMPTYLNQTRYDRLENEYQAATQSAIAAVTTSERAYVSVYSAWDLWADFRSTYGWEAQRDLYVDCGLGSWSQSNWDADTNQTGDCTHPERQTVNSNLGMIPADWMGKAIMRHVLGVAESRRAGRGTAESIPEASGPSNLWGSAVWGSFTWGS